MPKPISTLCSLGVAPFSSDLLSNLLDTIGLPAKYIFLHYFLLRNQPSFDQQLFFQADYEHFHFLSIDPCYYDDTHLEHGRPAVGLRLLKLLILIAALWTVIPGRQLQTFVPAMSKERTIPM